MKPADNVEKLIKKLQIDPSAEMLARTLSDTLEAQENSNKTKSALSGRSIWRTIMKSRITKLAAAAAIVVAVLISIHQLGGSVNGVAFADCVRPILTAESGSFKMTIDVVSSGLDWIDCRGEPVQTIEVMFAGPGRTRWNVPTGEVLVANMHEGKVMILLPSKKETAVMQVGPPGIIPPHNRFNKLFELRRIIEYALETEDESVEFLGEWEVDRVAALAYHVTGPQRLGDITVWADAESNVPIRIEQSMHMGDRKC
jgi:outer membrane lipoprotein-sorting protein